MEGPPQTTPASVALIATLHQAHETRLDRLAAVRRARVAFVSSPLPSDETEALVGRCRGRVVPLSDRPDLIVVPRTGTTPAVRLRSGAQVVDTGEFLAMHQAVVEAAEVSVWRLAVRSARLRLEDAVRLAGQAPSVARTALPTSRSSTEGRHSRMRTGAESRPRPALDARRAADAEALARRIDGVVHDLRSADPDARLYRR